MNKFILAGLFFLLLPGCTVVPHTTSVVTDDQSAALSFDVKPRNAKVYVDGEFVGLGKYFDGENGGSGFYPGSMLLKSVLKAMKRSHVTFMSAILRNIFHLILFQPKTAGKNPLSSVPEGGRPVKRNIRILTLVFSLVCIFSVSGIPAAQAGTAYEKFSRGLTNVLTGVFEIFRQPVVLAREKDYGPVQAFFGGLVKGSVTFVVRELAGVYELITFPVPVPEDYRSIIDPPTVFQESQLPRNYRN